MVLDVREGGRWMGENVIVNGKHIGIRENHFSSPFFGKFFEWVGVLVDIHNTQLFLF